MSTMKINVEQFASMTEWHKPQRRVWAKVISILVSVTFVFPYLTWAFEATSFPQPANLVMFNQQPIRIAHKLGTITQSFQGSERLVVHVQDLHCNYEVQDNIAKMIDVLAGEHGLELVGIEGASLPVNATAISTFPVAEVKKETAHYLVKQGKLTGAEMYAAIGQHRIRLEGIESAELYKHNRITVMKFLNNESQGYIFDLRETLDELKREIYNPVLTALDKKKQAFREGDLSLLKYSVYLYGFARQGGREELSLYPNLRAYVSKRKAMFSDLVDSDGLFTELDLLDSRLRAGLYTSAEQEKLDLLSHRLDIMEKLVNISASPQDLAEYRAAPEGFRVQKFLDFIARHDDLEEFILDAEVYKLDEYLGEVRNFYQVADDRSRAFVENIMARMQKHQTKVSMLVTGGYHTDMVLDELKQKGVSYICIKPRLCRQDIVNPYFSLLREQRTPLEKLLAQNQNILGIPIMLQQTKDNPFVVMTTEKFSTLGPKKLLDLNTIITLLKAGLLASLSSKKTSAAVVLAEYKSMIQNYAADRSQIVLINLKKINNNAIVAHFSSEITMLVHRFTEFTSSNIVAKLEVSGRTACVISAQAEEQMVEDLQTWSTRPASIFVGIQNWLSQVAESALNRILASRGLGPLIMGILAVSIYIGEGENQQERGNTLRSSLLAASGDASKEIERFLDPDQLDIFAYNLLPENILYTDGGATQINDISEETIATLAGMWLGKTIFNLEFVLKADVVNKLNISLEQAGLLMHGLIVPAAQKAKIVRRVETKRTRDTREGITRWSYKSILYERVDHEAKSQLAAYLKELFSDASKVDEFVNFLFHSKQLHTDEIKYLMNIIPENKIATLAIRYLEKITGKEEFTLEDKDVKEMGITMEQAHILINDLIIPAAQETVIKVPVSERVDLRGSGIERLSYRPSDSSKLNGELIQKLSPTTVAIIGLAVLATGRLLNLDIPAAETTAMFLPLLVIPAGVSAFLKDKVSLAWSTLITRIQVTTKAYIPQFRWTTSVIAALALVGMVASPVASEADKSLEERYIIWDKVSGVLRQKEGQPLVGGKTYQLAVLNEEHPEISLRSLGATSRACVDFLASDPELLPLINQLTRELDTSDEIKRVEVARKIMARIIGTEVPVTISTEIKNAYAELCEIVANGKEVTDIPVGIRSAGKAEDISLGDIPELKGINLGANAGQHDTLLGVTGADNVVEAWRACVASLFTDRVLDYRDGMMVYTAFGSILPDKKMTEQIIATLKKSANQEDRLVARALAEPEEGIKIITSLKFLRALKRNGFKQAAARVEAGREEFMYIEKIAMGVTIMPMAGVDISYVNFASDLMTGSGWTGFTFQEVSQEEYVNKGRVFTVTFMNDIGESIVQGLATADTYLVHVFEDENGEHINILARELGTKIVRAILKKPIMEELTLSEGDIDEILAAYADGFKSEFSEQLSNKLFTGVADLQGCYQVLAGLIKVGVSETENIAVDSETLAMFKYDIGQLNLLAHLLKRMMENRKEQTIFTVVPKELRNVFAGFDSQVVKVVKEICMPAQDNYGHLLDTEGAVGINLGQPNKPVILQRRPSNATSDIDNPKTIEISYTYVKMSVLEEVRELQEAIRATWLSRGDLLSQGIPTRNSFSGTIYKIDENQELAPQFKKIKEIADSGVEIIIRCRETTPDFVPILKHPNVKGVIANVGGATSHAAVISRELGIATIVGIQAWLQKLEEENGPEKAKAMEEYINTMGSIVTVDANADENGRGSVYAGEIPIATRKITIPIDRLPEIYTQFGYIMGMPGPMREMSKIVQYADFYGVALMRAEFVYGEENINPRGGAAYDNLMVYNYLMTRGEGETAKEFRKGLNAEEEAALQKVEMELTRRQEGRRKGIEVDISELEGTIDKYNSGEEFTENLSPYARQDLFSIKQHPEEIRKATVRLIGYLSYDVFFNAVHGGAVASMAAANSREKNTVVYRSIDFKKNEARELIFSGVFDPEPETATMLGERGARWLLQPENHVILRKEIRLLLKQVANGYTNIGFMFPFVATPGELQELLDITREEEKAMSQKYKRPVYLRKVGQMVELPSNVIQADEFAKILIANRDNTKQWFKSEFNTDIKRNTFFSFGTNDLTQTTLLADRDEPKMADLFDESHEFVIESIKHVVNVAIENGIECGLCGQAIVNLVNTNPETAEEILMLLGSTRGYAGTDYLGTEKTIVRSASATLKHGVCQASAGEEALIDGFMKPANLKGAAVRPLYEVQLPEDLKKTYIGDYVLIDTLESRLDLEDDDIIEMIGKLGAVIVSSSKPKNHQVLRNKLEQLRVPVIMLNDIGPLRNLLDKEAAPKITIDFNGQKIYGGEQAVEIVVPEKPSEIKIIKTITKEPRVLSFDNSVEAAQYYRELGIHPLVFMDYDDKQKRAKLDPDVVSSIKLMLQEARVSSAAEVYQIQLANYFKQQVKAKNGKYVYATSDMESDDFVKLKGNNEEKEINPPLGFAGLDSLVRDPQLRDLFKLEMGVIKQLLDEGYDIAIQFNTVKVVENLEEAIKVLSEVGIDPAEVMLGMNTASPGNYLFASKFIKAGQLDFVTLDVRKLAQAYLAAHLDGKNQKVSEFYTLYKIQENLARPIAMIKQAAIDADIPINQNPLEKKAQGSTGIETDETGKKTRGMFDTKAESITPLMFILGMLMVVTGFFKKTKQPEPSSQAPYKTAAIIGGTGAMAIDIIEMSNRMGVEKINVGSSVRGETEADKAGARKKAGETAEEFEKLWKKQDIKKSEITGMTNLEAVKAAAAAKEDGIVILAVNADYVEGEVEKLKDALNQEGLVIMSMANRLDEVKRRGAQGAVQDYFYPEKSTAEIIQNLCPKATVVSAFQNLPANLIKGDKDKQIAAQIGIYSDTPPSSSEAMKKVFEFVNAMGEGIAPFYAGTLEQSRNAEIATDLAIQSKHALFKKYPASLVLRVIADLQAEEKPVNLEAVSLRAATLKKQELEKIFGMEIADETNSIEAVFHQNRDSLKGKIEILIAHNIPLDTFLLGHTLEEVQLAAPMIKAMLDAGQEAKIGTYGEAIAQVRALVSQVNLAYGLLKQGQKFIPADLAKEMKSGAHKFTLAGFEQGQNEKLAAAEAVLEYLTTEAAEQAGRPGVKKMEVNSPYLERPYTTYYYDIPGRVVLPTGGAHDKSWWVDAEREKAVENSAPWGEEALVPVETQPGVLGVRITRDMLPDWRKGKPAGRNLRSSFTRYQEVARIAVAGLRHIQNIFNPHDTRQVKNSVERMITSYALGLMMMIKYNQSAGYPLQINYGHEVRYNSVLYKHISTRVWAAMGFISHIVPEDKANAIWITSTMSKILGFALSICGTASHALSKIDGLKIIGFEGAQFLLNDIQALIEIMEAIYKKIEQDGEFTFVLSEKDDPRISTALYARTNNGMDVYKEYQDAAVCDEWVLNLVKNLDPSKIHIDCMHGAAYNTLTNFFKTAGLEDLIAKLNWMHIEERADFGNIGKSMLNPKTGKIEPYDYGADATQVFEKKMPDGEVRQYFPVLCTADYPEKFAQMPIGDILLSTDMDHDRLVTMQILPNNEETKAYLKSLGVLYNVVNEEKIAALFIPNKSFHLLQEMNFIRITELMEQGKIDKARTMVVLKTLASTPAVDKWVEMKKAAGYKIEVVNTAVGFAKLANVMYRAETQMRDHPGEDVIIEDASGRAVNLGSNPILLAAWEESGGIIVGTTDEITDIFGKSFLALREKSATESILLTLAQISILQKNKGEVDLKAYLKEIYDDAEVDFPLDLRLDNNLYIPDTTVESVEQEKAGNERKNRIFGAYLAIVIAYMRKDLDIKDARNVLKDIFDQEFQARKKQGTLDDVFLKRFQRLNFELLQDIKFTGDGVIFVFEEAGKQWHILFRPSGTEPKLKAYGFGSETELLTDYTWGFAFNENNMGELPKSFTRNKVLKTLWGADGAKAVEKASRMQDAWELYGRVVDPADFDAAGLEELQKTLLKTEYAPPDNHLQLINERLEKIGSDPISFDLSSSPQAMPPAKIVELLGAVPETVYEQLGQEKAAVLAKQQGTPFNLVEAGYARELAEVFPEVIAELEQAKAVGDMVLEKKARKKLEGLLAQVADTTRATYDRMAEKYTELRGKGPEGRDLEELNKLLDYARKLRPKDSKAKVEILDVGTGIRDLAWLSKIKDVHAVGIDFAQKVVDSIRRLEKSLNVFRMDMNNLGFKDGSFDAVRSNTTLHHSPLIDSEQGADVVVREAHRVLKEDGMFYITVKADTEERLGFMGLDTGEGLGTRYYQFYNQTMLESLLERNGFLVEEIEEYTDRRGEKNLIAFARKKEIAFEPIQARHAKFDGYKQQSEKSPENFETVKISFEFLPESEEPGLRTYAITPGKRAAELEIVLPKKRTSEEVSEAVRYIAAILNNYTMTLGPRRIRINGLKKELFQEVERVLQSDFGQVLEAVGDFYGAEAAKDFLTRVSEAETLIPAVSAAEPSQPAEKEFDPKKGTTIGIDIGGTNIKAVIIRGGEVIQQETRPTFPPGTEKETAQEFVSRVAEFINGVKGDLRIDGIGLGWYGDTSFEGDPILNADTLQKFSPKEEYNNLKEMTSRLSEQFSVPVKLWGDSEANGLYHSIVSNLKSGAVLISGTSMGWAYLNSAGKYHKGFNLISRAVIDMSADALPHSDTQVKGVVQQYTASRGFVMVAKEVISRNVLADKKDVIQTINAQNILEVVSGLLEKKATQKIAEAILETSAEYTAAALIEMSRYYELERVILSGGIYETKVGKVLVEEISKRCDMPLDVRNLDLNYGGAIAAAQVINYEVQTASGKPEAGGAERETTVGISVDELQKATEAAAIAVAQSGLIGAKGDSEKIDEAATTAMRKTLNDIGLEKGILFRVVGGEGAKDGVSKAAMLWKGEELGDPKGIIVDIAVDPVDGTSLANQGANNAVSAIVAGREGALLPLPDSYMFNAVFWGDQKVELDLEKDGTKEILKKIADANGMKVEELSILIPDSERNSELKQELEGIGVEKIMEFSKADILNRIAVGSEQNKGWVYIGTAGPIETQMAAAALREQQNPDGSGSQLYARLASATKLKAEGIKNLKGLYEFTQEEVAEMEAMGLDPKKQYSLRDLVPGDAVLCVTPITDYQDQWLKAEGIKEEAGKSAANTMVFEPLAELEKKKTGGLQELESQIKQVAAILGLDETQARAALVESMDTTEVLDNFAESVGISKDAALANMIKAGLATDQGEGKFRLNSDMCGPAKLAEFIRLQVAASQNSEMVQLQEFPIRIERIITNSVKPEDFIGKLAEITKRKETNLAAQLSQAELFPTIVEYWKLTEALRDSGEDQTLQVNDLVNPKAVDYYREQGVDVEFSLPKKTKAGRRVLKALKQYWSAVWDNMARGGFNYRGMGTEQTVEQFYEDYFEPEWGGKIREFVKKNFDEATPLKAIVTNGIGANDQFMWSLVEMYNRNRKAGDPVWYHVVAARDLAKLQELNPENTLCIDTSRSGSTWEGVEIAERMLEKGFKKRITLANGGSLVEIGEANKASSLVIGMSPDIGGRNMHRKTGVYLTPLTVIGMFQPKMNVKVFADSYHKYDKANDFAKKEETLAAGCGAFLNAAMKLQGVNHIAVITNSLQLKKTAGAWEQYIMEGANKKDVITLGMHDLEKENEYTILENLAQSPAGKKTISMVLLDKAMPNYRKELRLVKELKKSMPLMVFTIDSRAPEGSAWQGMTPDQESAFDILWTDFITVLSGMLRIDVNPNPNVKVVREMTADYVEKWQETQKRYEQDLLGTGETDLLISLGVPGDEATEAVGTTEKQEPINNNQDARKIGVKLAQQLNKQGLLEGRDRMNVFVGSDSLIDLAEELKYKTFLTPLAKISGWITATGIYPHRAHKGHEATLFEQVARISINFFLHPRNLGPDAYFSEPFQDMTLGGKYANINGATVHETNDSMTMPNIQRAAQVSPTFLFEFNEMTPEIEGRIRALYDAFIGEVVKINGEIKDEGLLPGTIAQVNVSLLLDVPAWLIGITRLFNGWMLYQWTGLFVRAREHVANAQAINQFNLQFELLKKQVWNINTPELMTDQASFVSFQALSLKEVGLRNWLKGMFLGHQTPVGDSGKIIIHLPGFLINIMNQGPAHNNRLYVRAEQYFVHMVDYQSRVNFNKVVSAKDQNPGIINAELSMTSQEKRDARAAAKSLGQRQEAVGFYTKTTDVLLTPAIIIQALMEKLGAESAAKAFTTHLSSQLSSAGEVLSLEAVTAALSSMDAAEIPALKALQNQAMQIEAMPESKMRRLLSSKLLSSVLPLMGGRTETVQASGVNLDNKTFKMTGISETAANELLAWIDDALSKVAVDVKTEQLLEAAKIVLTQAKGTSVNQVVDLNSNAGAVFAELMLRAEINAHEQPNILGIDSRNKIACFANMGVEAVKVEGINAAVPLFGVFSSDSSKPEEMKAALTRVLEEQLGQLSMFAGLRRTPALVQAPNMVLNWLARQFMVEASAKYLPTRVRMLMDVLAMKTSPVYYFWSNMQNMDKKLAKTELLNKMQGMKLPDFAAWMNSNDLTALQLRQMVHATDSRSRGELAAHFVRIMYPSRLGIETETLAVAPEAGQISNFKAFTAFFAGMESVPMVKITLGDVDVSIPVAMIRVIGFKGALGLAIDKLEALGIAVDQDILDLYLRQGLRNSVDVAA